MSEPENKPKVGSPLSVEERLQALEQKVAALTEENASLKLRLMEVQAAVTVDELEPEDRKERREIARKIAGLPGAKDGPYWVRRPGSSDPGEEILRGIDRVRFMREQEKRRAQAEQHARKELGIDISILDAERNRGW